MSCSVDLKAYVVDELARKERSVVEDHVRGCQSCREELDRLNLTHAALASLEDEEIPRRIAFVSDRVFEPRWWQTMWRSGPVMGFASASVLAAAILVVGFARPVTVDTAQIERRVEAQVSTRLDAAVTKAVNEPLKFVLAAMNPLRTPFACRLNQRMPIHIESDDQAKGPRVANLAAISPR